MIKDFDIRILDFIYFNIKNPFLDNIMSFFTSIGDNGLVWIFIGAWFFFIQKDRKTFISIISSLILCLLVVNYTIKPLVARERPFTENPTVEITIERPEDYSFPSGHTASSFAGATAIWLCTNRRVGFAAFILCLIISFSRLYFYVHYPTDVIFGALLGVLLGIIGNYLSRFLKENGKTVDK